MTGIFGLRRSFVLSGLLVPLLAFTLVWTWYLIRKFKPLSKYVALSSVCEVQRGEEATEVSKLKIGHPVSWSQRQAGCLSAHGGWSLTLICSNLNRRRYAPNDETLYVAPEDERTDYSQPPMANWYHGVLKYVPRCSSMLLQLTSSQHREASLWTSGAEWRPSATVATSKEGPNAHQSRSLERTEGP
jgi:hypothetical protein